MNRRTMLKTTALGASGALLATEAKAAQQEPQEPRPIEVINPRKPGRREIVPLVVANDRDETGRIVPLIVGNDRDSHGVLNSRLDVATHATKQTWTYKLVPRSLLTSEQDNGMPSITQLGVEGWEAVAMIPGGLLFKLPFDPQR